MYAPRQYPDGSPWGPPPAPPTHPHHPYDPSNPPPSSFLPRIPELDGQQQQQQAGYGWMPQGPPAGEWAADPRYARSHNGAEYGYPPPPPPHPSGPPNMYADYNLYRFRMKPLRNGRLVIFDDFGRELRAHRDGSLRLVPLVMDEDEDGGGFGGDVKRMPPGDMSSKVPVKRPVPEEYPVDGYDKRRRTTVLCPIDGCGEELPMCRPQTVQWDEISNKLIAANDPGRALSKDETCYLVEHLVREHVKGKAVERRADSSGSTVCKIYTCPFPGCGHQSDRLYNVQTHLYSEKHHGVVKHYICHECYLNGESVTLSTAAIAKSHFQLRHRNNRDVSSGSGTPVPTGHAGVAGSGMPSDSLKQERVE